MVRPGTVADRVAPSTVAVAPFGDAATVYAVIGLPPSSSGGDHETVAEPSPGVAVTDCGMPGGRDGVGSTASTAP